MNNTQWRGKYLEVQIGKNEQCGFEDFISLNPFKFWISVKMAAFLNTKLM